MRKAASLGKSIAVDIGLEFFSELDDPYPAPIVSCMDTTPVVMRGIAEHWDPDTTLTPGLLAAHEFGAVLKRKRENIFELLNGLIDGRNATREHYGKPIKVTNPRLSGLFATTPPSIEAYINDIMADGGFLSRFTWVVHSRTEHPPWAPLDPNAPALKQVAVRVWRQLLAAADGHTERIMRPDGEAEVYFQSHWASLDPHQADYGIRKRLWLRVRLLAALYALLGYHDRITLDDAHRAASWVARLNVELGEVTKLRVLEDPMRLVNRAEEIIRQAGKKGVTQTELSRSFQVLSATRDLVLGTLLDNGAVLVESDAATDGKRGRKPTRYVHSDFR